MKIEIRQNLQLLFKLTAILGLQLIREVDATRLCCAYFEKCNSLPVGFRNNGLKANLHGYGISSAFPL